MDLETKSVTYTQNKNGDNPWGYEDVVFTFSNNVAGVYAFSYNNANIAYTIIYDIIITGKTCTLRIYHPHGVNSSNGEDILVVTVNLTV